MATFAEQMVDKLEALLLANAGLTSVTLESGTTVSYADLERKYEFWLAKVARETGAKPRVTSIDLSTAF